MRAIHVDEAWVDERADELRMKSYDFDHMRSIQERSDERWYERDGADEDR